LGDGRERWIEGNRGREREGRKGCRDGQERDKGRGDLLIVNHSGLDAGRGVGKERVERVLAGEGEDRAPPGEESPQRI